MPRAGRTQWQGGNPRSTPGRLSHSSSVPRPPQATMRQQHDALCKLMARAGMWEVIQVRIFCEHLQAMWGGGP